MQTGRPICRNGPARCLKSKRADLFLVLHSNPMLLGRFWPLKRGVGGIQKQPALSKARDAPLALRQSLAGTLIPRGSALLTHARMHAFAASMVSLPTDGYTNTDGPQRTGQLLSPVHRPKSPLEIHQVHSPLDLAQPLALGSSCGFLLVTSTYSQMLCRRLARNPRTLNLAFSRSRKP